MTNFKTDWTSSLKIGAILCAALFALAMSACDTGADTNKKNDEVTRITISPSTETIALDSVRTKQFTATVEGTGDFDKTVSWEALGNDNASTAINDSGMLTVAADEVSPAIIVKATSTANATISGTATVTVVPSSNMTPKAINITSAEDFKKIGVDSGYPLNADYTLTEDITLAMDAGWAGVAAGEGDVFSGSFDGGGKTITLTALAQSANTAESPDENGGSYADLGGGLLMGLFTHIGGTAEDRASVKNLTVAANVTMSASPAIAMSAGIVAGYSNAADFTDITLTGYVSVENTTKPLYLGGIIGTAYGSNITNCVNQAEIHGAGKAPGGSYDKAGGIVGTFNGGTVISNCHNSGDIYIVSLGQNGFAGGIAGGSTYNMSVKYHGIIEDCSSTGDIDAQGGGFWSFAGGIAGTITGQDPEGAYNPTRIVRCHASGNIRGSDSGWCYVGGITGYNYFGALISQCYFEGTVTGTNYTGGISGYNSKQPGHSSIIEDCWSSGSVTGTENAGGVVGQNQINAVIRRCYSTATVSVTTAGFLGIGGIAGLNMNSAVSNAVENCAALNTALTAASGENIHCVIGSIKASAVTQDALAGKSSNNYAWKGMTITVSGEYTTDKGADKKDGADCDQKPLENFYRDTLGWDFTSVWKMNGDYPTLQFET